MRDLGFLCLGVFQLIRESGKLGQRPTSGYLCVFFLILQFIGILLGFRKFVRLSFALRVGEAFLSVKVEIGREEDAVFCSSWTVRQFLVLEHDARLALGVSIAELSSQWVCSGVHMIYDRG